MKQCRASARSRLVVLLSIPVLGGCPPTVNVAGVYFPGWLVSTVVGVVVSYGFVVWLGRRRGARDLAASGVFFLSLATGVALAVWWAGFSGF